MTHKKENRNRFWLLGVLVTAMLALVATATAVEMRRVQANETSYLPLLARNDQPAVPPATDIDLVPFASGFTNHDGSKASVTAIVSPGPGDNRLFVVQQEGQIRIVYPDGSIEPEPFLDLSQGGPGAPGIDLVSTGDGGVVNWEKGMLGLAFHPNFAANGLFFVTYTPIRSPAQPNSVVLLRLGVQAGNPNKADLNNRAQLFRIDKPFDNDCSIPVNGICNYGVHNGGDLHFGPDGYLYVGIGDGGPDPFGVSHYTFPGDENNHAQRLDTLLGKMLRLDVDSNSGIAPTCDNVPGANYSIPPSNPFVGDSGTCGEIWASGLRNPWRFSFDRATGNMYIADVGEWYSEELNRQLASSTGGENYGWHCYEANADYLSLVEWDADEWPELFASCTAPMSAYTFPVLSYRTQIGNRDCSITGGFVYRGSAYPSLQGHYVFADFCSRRIWRAVPQAGAWEKVELDSSANFGISTFGENAAGELFIGGYVEDKIYRIVVP
jgi:glucose/arabinose dehydrogenase